MNKQDYTKTMRELLVSPPVDEQATLEPGKTVLYAFPVPMAEIAIIMAKVDEVLVGTNCNLMFRETNPSGGYRRHVVVLDHHLDVTSVREVPTSSPIFNDKSLGNEENVRYLDGVLDFAWKAPASGTKRVYKPDFTKLTPDANTLDFMCEPDKTYRIIQRILDGPEGSFTVPGFRQVPGELYDRLVDSEPVKK